MAMVPTPTFASTPWLDFSVKLTGVEKTAQVDRFSAKARADTVARSSGVTAAFAHRSSKGQSKQISRSYSLQVEFEPAKARCPLASSA